MSANADRIAAPTAWTLLFLILASAMYLGMREAPVPVAELPEPAAPCRGEPIAVDFPYMGTVNEPHTCAVQCGDDQPRYILYSNGKATQCETPPGCNDWGEDRGITCEVGMMSVP